MGPPSARSRHKCHSGNSWWKPIVLIWRRYQFAVSGANLLIAVSWPNRSRVHEGFRWRNWPKPRPKPRKSFFGLIDERLQGWIGRSAGDVKSGAKGAFVLAS